MSPKAKARAAPGARKAPGVDPEVAKLSFEQALGELEETVKSIDSGEVGLDDAIKAYEKGVQLRQHCERKLEEARERISRIEPGPDGSPTAVAADDEDVPF